MITTHIYYALAEAAVSSRFIYWQTWL